MGRMIQDDTTRDVLDLLNKRFGPGGIMEMVELQKEFDIFSPNHPLEQSFRLIGIEPADRVERKRWYTFLGTLKDYPSDQPNVSGYKRVVQAFRQALTQGPYLPVLVSVHAMKENPKVTFADGHTPLIYSTQSYRVLSIPTKPSQVARKELAAMAKQRRAKAKK
ncbi:hypothetical protein [Bradyrhizobium australafricanum]|uniref:hypothetical protein n=1 Tax=Bradyrhizobium australafricanum TaxID=2821406 RepID=UPI001CE26F6E|nr:hypothetical protein [Bradyrhizobium australafricanum]MCA6100375.1 hypothetical protein [Bradyrhizobium australafricanum]